MTIEQTSIEGLCLLHPQVFSDNRGYFFESYNRAEFERLGLHYDFVQDNQSFSTYGTIRGLHFQKGEHAQAKLVRVLQGRVLDVAVDLRLGSPTFGKWVSVELTDENKTMFMIPRGFAHGFSVLSETAVFAYKCDNGYCRESEGGILFNDPELAIDWRVESGKEVVSAKDLLHPTFNQYCQTCI